MATYYQSVRIKPQTIRSEVYFTGDVAYEGMNRNSSLQEIYNTQDPYLLKFLSEEEAEQINIEDARKIELSYLITNSIKMWLMSKVGDYGRSHPGMGGPLDEFIGKIVSEPKAKDIQEILTKKIEQTFSTLLTINTLTVIPVPERRAYQIQLVLKYLLVNKAFSVNEEFRV